MGKSCLRWTRLEDIPLDVVGDALASVGVEDFIAMYERARPAKKPAAKKPAAKKPAAKKPAAKKPAAAQGPGGRTRK
jgi:topoisomerase IA-like protein